MQNGGESFQCHVCFTTTHAAEGAQPAPTILFNTRCFVQRANPATPNVTVAGLYYLISTEDIGDDTFGDHVDYDVNVSAKTGGVINLRKIAAFVWEIQLFTMADATPVFVLSDLVGAGNVGAVVSVTLKRVDPA